MNERTIGKAVVGVRRGRERGCTTPAGLSRRSERLSSAAKSASAPSATKFMKPAASWSGSSCPQMPTVAGNMRPLRLGPGNFRRHRAGL